MSFTESLAHLMRERGVSARALATALELSNATVSGWLKGTFHPRPEQLRAAADFFAVSVDVLEGKGAPTKRSEGGVREDAGTTTLLANAAAQRLIARLDHLAAEVVEIRGDLASLIHGLPAAKKAKPAPAPKPRRRLPGVRVTLPSQTTLLSSETGKPIPAPAPSRGAQSA